MASTVSFEGPEAVRAEAMELAARLLPPGTLRAGAPGDRVIALTAGMTSAQLFASLDALARELPPEPAVAILGGSGFYELPGLARTAALPVTTPFGAPSADVVEGRLGGRRVLFLPRHGHGHALLPTEVNARANLFALKAAGATHVLSVSAVGSLREDIHPGDVVLPRQFIDRTRERPSTFFGEGVIAHVSLADPVCNATADELARHATAAGHRVHPGGTYVCIEGPQFSTRAESLLHRSWGADVVGMTNLPEARLAREAELCYATLTLPTDWDCWRSKSEEVHATNVLETLMQNVEKARGVLARALVALDPARPCGCRTALDAALVSPVDQLSVAAKVRLYPLLSRRLAAASRPSLR